MIILDPLFYKHKTFYVILFNRPTFDTEYISKVTDPRKTKSIVRHLWTIAIDLCDQGLFMEEQEQSSAITQCRTEVGPLESQVGKLLNDLKLWEKI